MLSTSDIQVVRRFVEAVRSTIQVDRVIVFGSRARGDADWDSDLDVMLVVEHVDSLVRQATFDAAWEAGFPNVVVTPILVSRDELESGPAKASPFYRTVQEEGILVHG